MKRSVGISILLITIVASLVVAGDLFQESWDHAWRGEHKAAVKGYRKFAKSNSDHPLAPGVYVYRLEAVFLSGSGATPTMISGKMVLMK